MAEMLGRREFRPGRKVDGHHAADVSYRKVWSADKLIVGHARIEPCKEMLNPKTSSLRERRDLFEGYRTGQGSALQPRSGISKSLLGGVDSIPLDPPQPGFNDAADGVGERVAAICTVDTSRGCMRPAVPVKRQRIVHGVHGGDPRASRSALMSDGAARVG